MHIFWKNSFHCAQSLLMPKVMLCWSKHPTTLSFLKAALLAQHLFLEKTQSPKTDLLWSSCMRKAMCPHLELLGLSMETYMSSMLCVSTQSPVWDKELRISTAGLWAPSPMEEMVSTAGLLSVDHIPSQKFYLKETRIQNPWPLLRDIQGKALWRMWPSLWLLCYTYVLCLWYTAPYPSPTKYKSDF